MGDRLSGATSETGWPFLYLIGTALSLGLVVGVRGALPEPVPSSELVAAGVVGLYTVLSVVYYYASVHRAPSRAVPADEL